MRELGFNCVWSGPYSQERIRDGFVDGEPNQNLIKTVRTANAQMMEAVHRPLDETSIALLHDAFHGTKGAYQRIMRERKQLLQKNREGR